jgi:hypothetical protein
MQTWHFLWRDLIALLPLLVGGVKKEKGYWENKSPDVITLVSY